jgi:hypothetical protein
MTQSRAIRAVSTWMGHRTRVLLALGLVSATLAGFLLVPAATDTPAQAAGGRVLLVGTYHGVHGQYTSIQSAVDAARPGDWILIAPGDYHETGGNTYQSGKDRRGEAAGVLVRTSDLHIRGMNRNSVVVDGTKPGSSPCSNSASAQDLGATAPGGATEGRNGIEVYKADNVTIQNLTVCNFLNGASSSGNEVWWNGGAESGKIGLKNYHGDYLTATSTYFGNEDVAAAYGIFSSNSTRGSWNHIYASNMNDSGSYVGACQQVCDMTIDHAWMEYSAIGYSGTNSGGYLVVENSQFDHNQDGFDTNTQIVGDPPAPQNGACPHHGISPITHTHSCWVFMHNYSHDNNNPNVPAAGSASNAPTGTGMTVSGGHNDTVEDNLFSDNGAWGNLFVPYPQSGDQDHQSCKGTGGVKNTAFGCVYDPEGDVLEGNRYHHDGYFGNPSNSDFGELTLYGGQPENCFAANRDPNGSSPKDLEQSQPLSACGHTSTSAVDSGPLLGQVLCDTGFGSCPAGAHYPQHTKVVMHRLPKLATMPDPCRGAPANAWCPAKTASNRTT